MILALMPLGVEHSPDPRTAAFWRRVILALMPLGVEHRCPFGAPHISIRVILALMPLGVEHRFLVTTVGNSSGDPRIDAVRR